MTQPGSVLAWAVACLAAVSAGCEDHPGATHVDAGTGGGTAQTACPPGQAERPDGSCLEAGVPADGCGAGFAPDAPGSCAPVLPAEPCAPGSLALLGETRCHEVAPCASGTWGDIPVEPGTQYVDGSYTGASSDGTAAHPWTRIQDAIDAAKGGLVAVAAGSYVESLDLTDAPARIWGVCPKLVEVVGVAASQAAVVAFGGADGAELHRFAIRGPMLGAGFLGTGKVVLERMWIHDTADRALTIEDTIGHPTVEVTGSLIEANGDVGVFGIGANVTIEDCVVRDGVGFGPAGAAGGIEILHGPTGRSSATVRASVVERRREAGIRVSGSDATLEDLVVRDTAPNTELAYGRGIDVHDDPKSLERANVIVRSAVVERSREMGVYVIGSDATIENVVVRDTLAAEKDGHAGWGIGVQDRNANGLRAAATIRSSLVERSQEVGVFVSDSTATLESVRIVDTQPSPNGTHGRGIHVEADLVGTERATAAIRWCAVERSYDTGILVLDSDATIDASLVDGTEALADGSFGDGIAVVRRNQDATVDVTSCLIRASKRAGFAAFGGSATIATTSLECNTIPLDSEKSSTLADGGGNTCGCEGTATECVALPSNLAPPEPLE